MATDLQATTVATDLELVELVKLVVIRLRRAEQVRVGLPGATTTSFVEVAVAQQLLLPFSKGFPPTIVS